MSAMATAGLAFVVHSFRHTFATKLVEATQQPDGGAGRHPAPCQFER
jgi:integrase